ncbi:MAG: ABC transporter permease [Planctomycetota bacterium]|jgi:putative ABC transport system permease protein
MFRYALNNLFAKKVRTVLSLVLLAMVLAGTIGLISLSSGMRSSVTSALTKLEGIAVIAKGSADPIFSTLPASLVEKVAAVEGVKVAIPEIWGIVIQLDGTSPLTKGWFSAAAFGGLDPEGIEKVEGGGLYGRALVAGRFLRKGDRKVAVMSRKLAREYGKRLGGSAKINGVSFEIVGLYHTGSMFLDQSVLMPIDDARKLKNMQASAVSVIYAEPLDSSKESLQRTAASIQTLAPGIEAKTKYDWHEDFNKVLGSLDAFFTAQSAYIAILGMIIVLLTMTMSVMERTREFGILKAVGWTRKDVMFLVILESVLLGATAGFLGCFAGVLSTEVIGAFMPYEPLVPFFLVIVTFTGGIVLGLLGGLYPAYRASSLNPVEAIRTE